MQDKYLSDTCLITFFLTGIHVVERYNRCCTGDVLIELKCARDAHRCAAVFEGLYTFVRCKVLTLDEAVDFLADAGHFTHPRKVTIMYELMQIQYLNSCLYFTITL